MNTDTETKDCCICFEEASIECPFKSEGCYYCSECLKTWILEQKSMEMRCACHTPARPSLLTPTFIISNIPKFTNKFFQYLAEIQTQIQIQMIPAEQIKFEQIKRLEQERNEYLNERGSIYREENDMKRRIIHLINRVKLETPENQKLLVPSFLEMLDFCIIHNVHQTQIKKLRAAFCKEIKKDLPVVVFPYRQLTDKTQSEILTDKMIEINTRITNLKQPQRERQILEPQAEAPEPQAGIEREIVRSKKIFHCSNEECVGQSEQEVCSICSTKTCSKCHEKKEPEHKCDKGILETMKLLRKETKPCPKCRRPIEKQSGCNQMWCPCNTFFDWISGNEVITKFRHNPHYFNFIRRQQEERRREGFLNCEDRALERWRMEYERQINHVLDLVNRLRVSEDREYGKLREKVVSNDMSVYTLTEKIKFIQKDFYHSREFIDTITQGFEFIQLLLREINTRDEFKTLIEDNIYHLNKALHRMRIAYGRKTPHILFDRFRGHNFGIVMISKSKVNRKGEDDISKYLNAMGCVVKELDVLVFYHNLNLKHYMKDFEGLERIKREYEQEELSKKTKEISRVLESIELE